MMINKREISYNAEQVRALRYRIGMSQLEFSIATGIRLNSIRNWEQGRRLPNELGKDKLYLFDFLLYAYDSNQLYFYETTSPDSMIMLLEIERKRLFQKQELESQKYREGVTHN